MFGCVRGHDSTVFVVDRFAVAAFNLQLIAPEARGAAV